MKSNKLSIIAITALGGLMAFGPLAQAQDTNAPAVTTTNGAAGGRPPRGAGGAQAKAMQAALDKLDLSADQKEKVKAAVKDQREKLTAMRADTTIAQADRRPKMKEINDAFDAKMKEILSADQYTKWETVKPAQRQGGRGAGAGGGAGGAAGGTPKPEN